MGLPEGGALTDDTASALPAAAGRKPRTHLFVHISPPSSSTVSLDFLAHFVSWQPRLSRPWALAVPLVGTEQTIIASGRQVPESLRAPAEIVTAVMAPRAVMP